MIVAAVAVVVAITAGAEDSLLLWPFPRHVRLLQPTTDPWLALSRNVTIDLQNASSSSILTRGAARFERLLRGQAVAPSEPATSTVRNVEVVILSSSEHLGTQTNYSYELQVSRDASVGATIMAASPFGALYALETFAQLCANGSLPAVRIIDSPMYVHRGLMLDTGRRFHPVDLVKSMLDAMAMVKLNVLHFHLSDQCRFAVESTRFPALTANLTGLQSGHYTQDDVRQIVAYAADRGIRVIPEFDVPGHTGGWAPLKMAGLQYCGSWPEYEERPQLYHDPQNVTLGIVSSVLEEMSALLNRAFSELRL